MSRRHAALLVFALAVAGLTVAILLRPVHHPPRLLVGVDDDTVKWTDHNPYPLASREPPPARHTDGTLGEGDYGTLLDTLRLAFAGTKQALPGDRGVTVWYLEDGFQSSVPPGKRHLYVGHETESATATALLQADRVGAALRLAACQADVGAYFNFELTDEDRLVGWQSGLLRRDGTRKPAYAALRRAAADIRAGRVDCQ